MKKQLEKILGRKTHKRTGRGSMKGLTSYYPDSLKSFDWEIIQILKHDPRVVFCSVDCISVKNEYVNAN